MEKAFILVTVMLINLKTICQTTSSYVDNRDDKEYKTVKIGNQIWFAENLAFETKKGSWIYDKNIDNLAKYGRLYNWKTACSVCPDEWRLPSIDDFQTLLKNLNTKDSLEFFNALVEGGTSGFEAKFAGWYAGRRYGQLDEHTDFWTSTIYQPFPGATKNAYRFSIFKLDKLVYWNPTYWFYAFSVRCVKD
jgi:uncharacterized protein (TIGR02145 family)